MTPLNTLFARLITEIQPLDREVAAARRHITGVRGAVARHLSNRTPIAKVVNIGSYRKGTGIAGNSDVDLLFVMAREDVRWGGIRITSTTLMERVRRAISATYRLTSVARDRQAVAVRFARTAVSLDIVPALAAGRIGTANAYLIPDGSGGWLKVAPPAELRRFRRANVQSRRKLARTVQLLKLWKHSRSPAIQLRSYYIELLLTVSGIATGARSYSEILTEAFELLHSRGPAALRDPDGRVGLTHPVSPRVSREKVMDALERATDLAIRARTFEAAGDIAHAATQWRLIFNGFFPRP